VGPLATGDRLPPLSLRATLHHHTNPQHIRPLSPAVFSRLPHPSRWPTPLPSNQNSLWLGMNWTTRRLLQQMHVFSFDFVFRPVTVRWSLKPSGEDKDHPPIQSYCPQLHYTKCKFPRMLKRAFVQPRIESNFNPHI